MKLSSQLNIVPTRRRLPPELFLNVYGFKGEKQRHISKCLLLAVLLTLDNNFRFVLSIYLPQKQAPARQTDLLNKALSTK